MKCGKIAAAVLAASLLTGAAFAMDKPVLLSDQGSFEAGGTVVTTPGTFDNNHPLNQAGQTLHGDHAYVFYQKPAKAHKNSIVFLHGHGQSGKTWETTPDGRDGFQNIFLEKGIIPTSSTSRGGRPASRRIRIFQRIPMSHWTNSGSIISASAITRNRMIMPRCRGMQLHRTSSCG